MTYVSHPTVSNVRFLQHGCCINEWKEGKNRILNDGFNFDKSSLKRLSDQVGVKPFQGGISFEPKITPNDAGLQGLRGEFQMTGANHYLTTLIQSKTVQFSYFSGSFWKINGCKWGFLKIGGWNCTRYTCCNGVPADLKLYVFKKLKLFSH